MVQYTPKTVSIHSSLKEMDLCILKLIEAVYFYSNSLNRAGYRIASILSIKITADCTLLNSISFKIQDKFWGNFLVLMYIDRNSGP